MQKKKNTKTASESADHLQLVCKIGNEEFGINILQVQEIIRMVEISSVPNAPSYIEGIINFRGKVIPVMSLRGRFGIEKKEKDQHTRIIVVELDGSIIGFIVDAVSEVLRISTDATEIPPSMAAGDEADYITAVAKLEDRMLILLDLDKVIDNEEMHQMQELA